MKTKYYDYNGEELESDGPTCVAIAGKDDVFFRVKRDTRNFLFNVVEDKPANLTKNNSHRGTPEFKFVTTTKEGFGLYLSFLQRKDINLLRQAERIK